MDLRKVAGEKVVMASAKVEFKCQCGYEFRYNIEAGFLQTIKVGDIENVICPQCKKDLMPESKQERT